MGQWKLRIVVAFIGVVLMKIGCVLGWRIHRVFFRIQSWAKSVFSQDGSQAKRAKGSQLARRRALSRALRVEGLEDRRVFAGLVINEISVDPAGTDQPFEYVELKGIPNALLTNFYFVSVEGDSPSGGLADRVYDLSTQTLGSSGLL